MKKNKATQHQSEHSQHFQPAPLSHLQDSSSLNFNYKDNPNNPNNPNNPIDFDFNIINNNNKDNIDNINNINKTHQVGDIATPTHTDDFLPDLAATVQVPPLTALRMARGDSVETVAAILRLSPAQVNALELRHWAALPDAAYIKGFLRNYARYLGIDAQPYLNQFEAALALKKSTATPIASSITAHGLHHTDASKNNPIVALAPLKTITATSPLGRVSAVQFKSQSSNEGTKPAYSLIKLAVGLVMMTVIFLLVWEQARWLPAVQHYGASIGSWVHVASPAVSATPVMTVTPLTVVNTPTIEELPYHPAPEVAVSPTVAMPANEGSASSNIAIIQPEATQTKPVQETKPVQALGTVRSVDMQMLHPVWIEVRDANQKVLAKGLKEAGTRQLIVGEPPLKVVIGTADAVVLKVDGTLYDFSDQADGNVAKFVLP